MSDKIVAQAHNLVLNLSRAKAVCPDGPDGQEQGVPPKIQKRNSPSAPAENIAVISAERKCRQAIRHFCLECQGRLPKAVDNCEDDSCPLYLFRLNDPATRPDQPGLPLRPLRAVRRQCMACCANERDEIRHCSAGKSCSLWEFRFGVSPAVYRRVKERLRGPRHYTLPGLDLIP